MSAHLSPCEPPTPAAADRPVEDVAGLRAFTLRLYAGGRQVSVSHVHGRALIGLRALGLSRLTEMDGRPPATHRDLVAELVAATLRMVTAGVPEAYRRTAVADVTMLLREALAHPEASVEFEQHDYYDHPDIPT